MSERASGRRAAARSRAAPCRRRAAWPPAPFSLSEPVRRPPPRFLHRALAVCRGGALTSCGPYGPHPQRRTCRDAQASAAAYSICACVSGACSQSVSRWSLAERDPRLRPLRQLRIQIPISPAPGPGRSPFSRELPRGEPLVCTTRSLQTELWPFVRPSLPVASAAVAGRPPAYLPLPPQELCTELPPRS